MSSITVSTVTSVILQLIIVLIVVTAMISIKKDYLESAFMDRSNEICIEMKFLSLPGFEGRGTIDIQLPMSMGGSNYQISFNPHKVSISGEKEINCSIPWLDGQGKISGPARLEFQWGKNSTFVRPVI